MLLIFRLTTFRKKMLNLSPLRVGLRKIIKHFTFPIFTSKKYMYKTFQTNNTHTIYQRNNICQMVALNYFCINLIFTSTITLDFRWEHTCTRFAFLLFQEPLPADITLVNVESVQFECPLLWNSGDVQTDCAAPTACSTTDDTVQRTCHLLIQSR